MSAIRIQGDRATIKALESLSPKLRRRALRLAVSKSLTPLNKEIKSRVPAGHKNVKKSIGKRTKTYRQSGVVVGIVGPRVYTKGFADDEGVTRTSKETAAEAKRLEFGTKFERARPFVRPAFINKRSSIERLLASEIGRAVDRLAKQT